MRKDNTCMCTQVQQAHRYAHARHQILKYQLPKSVSMKLPWKVLKYSFAHFSLLKDSEFCYGQKYVQLYTQTHTHKHTHTHKKTHTSNMQIHTNAYTYIVCTCIQTHVYTCTNMHKAYYKHTPPKNPYRHPPPPRPPTQRVLNMIPTHTFSTGAYAQLECTTTYA